MTVGGVSPKNTPPPDCCFRCDTIKTQRRAKRPQDTHASQSLRGRSDITSSHLPHKGCCSSFFSFLLSFNTFFSGFDLIYICVRFFIFYLLIFSESSPRRSFGCPAGAFAIWGRTAVGRHFINKKVRDPRPSLFIFIFPDTDTRQGRRMLRLRWRWLSDGWSWNGNRLRQRCPRFRCGRSRRCRSIRSC